MHWTAAGCASQFDMMELACRFNGLPEEELGGYVGLMVQQGQLAPVAGQAATFRLTKPAAKVPCTRQRPHSAEAAACPARCMPVHALPAHRWGQVWIIAAVGRCIWQQHADDAVCPSSLQGAPLWSYHVIHLVRPCSQVHEVQSQRRTDGPGPAAVHTAGLAPDAHSPAHQIHRQMNNLAVGDGAAAAAAAHDRRGTTTSMAGVQSTKDGEPLLLLLGRPPARPTRLPQRPLSYHAPIATVLLGPPSACCLRFPSRKHGRLLGALLVSRRPTAAAVGCALPPSCARCR